MKTRAFLILQLALSAATMARGGEIVPTTKPATSPSNDSELFLLAREGVPTTQPSFPIQPSTPREIVLQTREGFPSTQPSTQPVSPEVAALIRSLGDDDPKVRQEATAKLKKLGRNVLPALNEAAKSDDPQIRTSAEALIFELQDRPRVASAGASHVLILPNGGGQFHMNGVQGNVMVQMHIVNNGQATRDMTINENGHKVHIHETKDELQMEVTDNGETKEYKAKNAAELKEKEPEAYKTYEKYSANGGLNQVEIHVGSDAGTK